MNTDTAIIPQKSSKRPVKYSIKRKVLFVFVILAILVGCIYLVLCMRYKSLIKSLEKAAENEYISENSNELGGMTYYKNVYIEDKEARSSLRIPSGASYDVVWVVKQADPIVIDENKYEINIMMSINQFPWDRHYFLGWTSDSEASSLSRGVEIDKDGELCPKSYKTTTAEERKLISKMRGSYYPLLEYLYKEYDRLINEY